MASTGKFAFVGAPLVNGVKLANDGLVASNFFGRLMSAAVADTFGISTNFLTFAALNLIGAALVWFTLQKTSAPRHSRLSIFTATG